MTRDAREAVCAALFWRGDPGERHARDARFKHSLILWCLSAQAGRMLARRWPDDVHVLDFNRLVSGDRSERHRVAQHFGIEIDSVNEAYEFVPDFHLDPVHGFLLPDGRRAKLLSAVELKEVSILTGSGDRDPIIGDAAATGGNHPRRRFIWLARAVLALGRVSPGLARAAADLAYYPHRYMMRRVNSLRQLLTDL